MTWTSTDSMFLMLQLSCSSLLKNSLKQRLYSVLALLLVPNTLGAILTLSFYRRPVSQIAPILVQSL